MFQTIDSGASARTLPPFHLKPDEQLPFRVRDHVQRLKLIIPVLSVSVLALKAQNADLDEDIASVLHHQASAPLDREIEELEALLESIAAQRAKEAA